MRKAFTRAAFAAALVGGSLAVLPTAAADAAPTWAPAATAAIHPGVQTFTNGAQCTANFVFFDGGTVYIGQAAHCAGTGGNTATNGCTSGSLPLGTPVTVTGASKPGTLVYSSWLTMQGLHEADANTCQYNDLALVQLDPSDAANVNPTIPHWGGPNGIAATGTSAGAQVYSYGNSELRGGVTQLSPKTGVSLGDAGNGWSHNVVTVSPGIPGDSGSAFLDASGHALGILSTLELAPIPASNGVGDLNLEVQYLHAHSGFGAVQLALGTAPFNGSQLPLGT
ncbi:MAG TPA: serine protease [Acidimicrobiia bacterium]